MTSTRVLVLGLGLLFTFVSPSWASLPHHAAAEAPFAIVAGAASQYFPHPPILIRGDAMFSLPTSGVVAGDGSAGSPYVISGWDLTPLHVHGNGADDGDSVGQNCQHSPIVVPTFTRFVRLHAIEIMDTTKHVVIQSNRIQALDPGPGVDSRFMIGIFLENAPNVRIVSNQIGSDAGPEVFRAICARNADSLIIETNTITRTTYASVYFEQSTAVAVRGNTIQSSSGFEGVGGNGISFTSSNGPIIRGNLVTGHAGVGIGVSSSAGAIVEDNTVNNNKNGISVSGASNSATVTRNLVQNNAHWGVTVTSSQNVEVHNNNIQGNTVLGANGLNFYINAENNYWGCVGGPGTTGCDSAVGVDFTPWLSSPVADAGP